MTIVDDIAYFLSRLPFGSNEGPGKHDIPSNMVVKLAQLIADDPTWDPKDLFSPRAADIPADITLDEKIPHGKANPLLVSFDEEKDCYFDGYIDDLIGVVLQLMDILDCGRNAVALALYSFFRPANPDDPLPRDDILSLQKLLAEGGLTETKRILGWYVDTRCFLIKLTSDKSLRWNANLSSLIQRSKKKESVSTKEIETTIGRLNTAAYICTKGRFFLSRLRYCLKLSKQNRGSTVLPKKVILDLELWQKMLTSLATRGRSINLVTYTLPHWFTKQDASTEGLGGFICIGLGWRYIIPPELRELIHINILEFLSILITAWLSILFFQFDHSLGLRFLAQSDNTCALGWLKGSTRFDKTNKMANILREMIGRKFAELLIEAGISSYSQHLKASRDLPRQPKNSSPPGGDSLMDLILLGGHDSDRGVTKGTLQKIESSHRKWNEMAARYNLDPFLRDRDEQGKAQIFGAFAYALRHNFAGTTSTDELRGKTVHSQVNAVSAAFRSMGFPDPIRDASGKMHQKLNRQLKCYKNEDPPEAQEVPLPLQVFKEIALHRNTKLNRALSDLIIGALFIGARSCEYSKTPSSEHKKTKPLEIRDFTFYDKKKKVISHHDQKLIKTVHRVRIAFRDQKNGHRFENVIIQVSKNRTLCGTRAWARIIRRLWSYPGTTDKTKIYTFFHSCKKEPKHITSRMIIDTLRKTVRLLGEDKLGVPLSLVGTHSIRTSFAMLLKLNGADDSLVMQKGRWKSNAFLRYICTYIDSYGDEASDMISNECNGNFISLGFLH